MLKKAYSENGVILEMHLEMPKKADSEYDVILEITKRFHASTIVFNVITKMKILRKQLLNKLQQNFRRR
jgi:hypothetical protein